jgi:GntR family transcriptional regulator
LSIHVAPSAIDPASGEPLYLQVKKAIAADISERKLRPSERLPSERRICQAFGVSRVTARRALRALVEDGVIESAAGRGWFVANGPIGEPRNVLQSFSAMARARGLEPTARVLRQLVRPATIDEAEALEVVPGADLLDLERLRLLDELPVAVDWSRLPLSRVPGLEATDFETASLYATLQESFGVVPTCADYGLEAGGADEETSSLLGLKPGAPVLVASATTYGQDGRPIDLGRIVYRGDRYRFRTRLFSGG